jgi:hypothetical protein
VRQTPLRGLARFSESGTERERQCWWKRPSHLPCPRVCENDGTGPRRVSYWPNTNRGIVKLRRQGQYLPSRPWPQLNSLFEAKKSHTTRAAEVILSDPLTKCPWCANNETTNERGLLLHSSRRARGPAAVATRRRLRSSSSLAGANGEALPVPH